MDACTAVTTLHHACKHACISSTVPRYMHGHACMHACMHTEATCVHGALHGQNARTELSYNCFHQWLVFALYVKNLICMPVCS